MTQSALPAFDTATLQGVTRLTHWGVIRAAGEDAAKFLHGQLTQDFALLGEHEARLAGYCNAKGRMQASFIGFKRSPDEILLVCSRDLLAATLKRLNMFVLRAKVKLSDASEECALYGVAGAAVPPVVQALPRWGKAELDGRAWVRLPDGVQQIRALCCAPAQTGAPQGDELPLPLWQWLEVSSAVVQVTQPVFEAFVPQMLNYESVGGVNFKKGCYPGQEVVARSQFRGTLKRRAYLLHTDGQPQVGQEVFHASDAEQPCGTVAAVAPHPNGGHDLVASLQTTATDGQRLSLGSSAGAEMTLLPLPYELLTDI